MQLRVTRFPQDPLPANLEPIAPPAACCIRATMAFLKLKGVQVFTTARNNISDVLMEYQDIHGGMAIDKSFRGTFWEYG